MDILVLLKKEIQEFISKKIKQDTAQLVLKGSPFPNIDIKPIVEQIQAKRKAEKKIPTWFNTKNILYPPTINFSQSSSELTAKYKSEFIKGDTLIDITGGFGIDDYFFSQSVNQVIHCELNSELSRIAEHNFIQLTKLRNCKFKIGNGLNYIERIKDKVDWIYCDPGRRSASGNKVFRLEDSQPNILEHLDKLLSKSHKILLKTSPLLDLKQGINQLKGIEEVHVVAVKNDVKELLWVISNSPNLNPLVKTINFTGEASQNYSAYFNDEETAKTDYALPQTYLYEPNAAILKSGFFKIIGPSFNVSKLAPNTHLYTSQKPIKFPGRRFKILEILPAHKKSVRKAGIAKANVTIRNFPMSVQQIRKIYKIKDGGSKYLFFTQTAEGKNMIIHTKKIANN